MTKLASIIVFSSLLLFCGTASAHTVTLSWTPSTDATPLHQNLWRQTGCTGTYEMRVELAATVSTFIDPNVKNGMSYCYYVTVTDKSKKISPESNVVTAVIPAK
jgi:hypothetical protein|tara:strand:+ start:288 stop:599 length:312 start_codon:yes stop_codon:yes gene_type:complete